MSTPLLCIDGHCANAAKVWFPLILWKNNLLLTQKVLLGTRLERLPDQAFRVCCGAGKNLASFRRFLGGGGEEEFVVCAAWTAQSEPVQAKDTFEVGKRLLDLFPELHREFVLGSLRNGPRHIAGIFMFFTGDLVAGGLGAAFGFGRARLSDMFEGLIFGDAFSSRTAIGIRVISTELFQGFAFRTDILIVFGLPLEVSPGPSPISATSFINDRDTGRDIAIH